MVEAERIRSGNVAGRWREGLATGPNDRGLCLCAVAEESWCQHLPQRLRLQELAAEQSRVPTRHVRRRRAYGAGGIGHAHVGEVGVAELSWCPADQAVA